LHLGSGIIGLLVKALIGAAILLALLQLFSQPGTLRPDGVSVYVAAR
jgi:hypothetical protein